MHVCVSCACSKIYRLPVFFLSELPTEIQLMILGRLDLHELLGTKLVKCIPVQSNIEA